MAVIYCEYCHLYIDEDWNVEHFLVEDDRYGCIVEEEHKEEEIRKEVEEINKRLDEFSDAFNKAFNKMLKDKEREDET